MQLLTWGYMGLATAMWMVCATARLTTPRANAVFGVASFVIVFSWVPVGFYAVAGDFGYLVSLEDRKLIFPPIDAMLLAVVAGTWSRNPRWWKLAMMSILTAQLIEHAAFWTFGRGNVLALWVYTSALNVEFAAQSVVLMLTGLPHARSGFRDLLRGPDLRVYRPPQSRVRTSRAADAPKQ